MLIAVSVIALIAVLVVFLFGHVKKRLTQTAIALFAAGVAGNLYDRAFNDGLVRDFIDIVYLPGKHWPAFNVADSFLTVSVVLLIVSSILTERSARIHDPLQK